MVKRVFSALPEEIGLDMGRMVRVDVHPATLDNFDAMDAAYRESFEDEITQRELPRNRVGFLAVAALKLLAWRNAGNDEAPKGGKAVRVPGSITDRSVVR